MGKRLEHLLTAHPLATLGLAAWVLLVAVQVISPLWYPTPDAANYLSIARSLTTKAVPTRLGSPNLVFGIGYPLLVSPVFLVAERPFLALSLVHLTWAGIYLAGSHAWARRYVANASLPIALIAVGNVTALVLFRRALSEVAFLGVMIWLAHALAGLPQPGRRGALRLLAATLLLTLLVLIRPAGILFAAGFALVLGQRLRQGTLTWKAAAKYLLAFTLPALLALSSAVAYSHLMAARERSWTNLDVLTASAHGPATDERSDSLLMQCADGLVRRVGEPGRLLVPGMFGAYGGVGGFDVNLLVVVPFFALCVFGWWRFVRRHVDAFALALPAYFALHVYWPFDQGGRYFAPLLPLFLVCCWFALERLGPRRLLLAKALVAAHVLVAGGHWLVKELPRARAADRNWPELLRLVEPVHREEGTVQVAHELGQANFQLEFLLDRPVLRLEKGEPPDPGVAWLVLPKSAPCPEGFGERAQAGRFTLWQRSPAANQLAEK